MPTALRAALPFVLMALVAGCGPEKTTAPVVAASSSPTAEAPMPETPAPAPDARAASNAGDSETKTLFVREERVDCEGVGPQKCLQVRESESEDWTLFYSSIEGFTYEEGTKYELRVAIEPSPHAAAADAPSHRYVLVEIVSQQRTAR